MPRSSTCWRARDPQTDLYVFSNLSMDTLDYTGPGRERGLEGRVARARRSGARAAARVSRRRCRRRRTSTDVRVFCGGCLVVGAPPFADDPRRAGAARGASGLRRLAAGGRQRRARARHAQRHELPVDDVHALRAGGRHPRRRPARRAQPHRLRAADRHRRADEALVSEGSHAAATTSPRRVTRALEGVLPVGEVEMGDSERGHLD